MTSSAGDGGADVGAMGPLVARFSWADQRLRQADRAHPWVLDTALLMLVLLAFCLPDLLGGRRRRAAPLPAAFARLPIAGMLALQPGLVVPLLWRRRRPAAVAFGAVTGAFVLQFWLGAALRADVALFIALHGRLR